jgi:hypothetical protein
MSWQQMLEAFGLDPADAIQETHLSAARGPDRKVRAGHLDGWGLAIEASSSVGSDDDIMARLSIDSGEAFNLTYTELIQTFTYFADGERVCGFDLVAPDHRRGTDVHRFDDQLAASGLRSQREPTHITGPRFIHLAFGFDPDPAVFERELPSVNL